MIARDGLPISAAALVNPMVRVTGAVAVNERGYNLRYEWTDAARAVADRFDFIRRATEIAAAAPALLVVSGEDDDPDFRADAEALERELAARYRDASRLRWHSVPGMPHHLAEPPGLEPAPQNAHAAAVDAVFTSWFAEHLCQLLPDQQLSGRRPSAAGSSG